MNKRKTNFTKLLAAWLLAISAMIMSACSDAGSAGAASEKPLISENEAMEIALARVPGADKSHFKSFYKELDDGIWIYDGEIVYDKVEYDFEIDGGNGNILEWQIDHK